MGNEGSNQRNTNNRRRSLPTKNYDDSTSQVPRKDYSTINYSLEMPPPSAEPRQYRSIEYEAAGD